jgi:peptidyl-tRNA hydrolase, PTH2 family
MLKQIIVVRKDLNMRKGKIGAQCAHASMGFISEQIRKQLKNNEVLHITLKDTEYGWFISDRTKIVAGVDSEHELKELITKARDKGIMVYPVIDAGKTEFDGVPTLTCAAFGPNVNELIDSITGHLKLI